MTKLYFPEITKISDVFSEAKLAEGMPPRPSEWRYLIGFCGHLGGSHYIRTYRKTGKFFCFGRSGAKFISTWVKPHPHIIEAISPYLISLPGSMEMVNNSILLKDDQGIGHRHVAVLYPGETPLTLMSPEDQKFWNDQKAIEAEVKSLVTDHEVVDLARVEELGVPVYADA